MYRRFAILPLALLLGSLLSACSQKVPAPEPVRAVKTWVVGAAAPWSGQEFAADIRARSESRLGFRVGGKLALRQVNLGDSVRAGQVLAELDPQDLKLGQEAAAAALNAAQVNAQQAKADWQRTVELRAQGFVGAAELERRESAWKAAQAQLDQAKAQSGNQSNQLAYAKLLADVSGVITGVDAEPGQVLAAGTPVVRIAQDGPRDAVFVVAEDKLSTFKALRGKSGALQVRLWAGNQTIPATVREVAAAADAATRTFQVKADLGGAAVSLGQTATVLLPADASANVLRLPLTALLESGGKTQVWVLDKTEMKVQLRPVQVASVDGNGAVIASGLKTGEEVITAGVHVLTPGQSVSRYTPAGAQP